ncbi:MAG: hypothetical protein ABL952_16650 [Pyrinomonadaceae bacterium]
MLSLFLIFVVFAAVEAFSADSTYAGDLPSTRFSIFAVMMIYSIYFGILFLIPSTITGALIPIVNGYLR